jgi:hypothetical protein
MALFEGQREGHEQVYTIKSRLSFTTLLSSSDTLPVPHSKCHFPNKIIVDNDTGLFDVHYFSGVRSASIIR